jgi:hypothetical protein
MNDGKSAKTRSEKTEPKTTKRLTTDRVFAKNRRLTPLTNPQGFSMDMLSIVALVLLIFMIGLIISLIWFLGGMPGRVAASRNHPNAQAIQVGGWASLFCGVVIWPIVLMWAYSEPARQASATDGENDANMHQQLTDLQVKVARLAALVAKTGGQAL